MTYYPIFLDLRDKECLVIGAGSVGIRKVLSLIKAKPKKIIVIDPKISNNVLEQIPKGVVFKKREFKESDLHGKFLVIVATNNKEINKYIGELCKKYNLLCNVVDNPDLCSFIVPALIDKKDIKIAISTSGKSPAMASFIKQELSKYISDELITLTELIGKIRSYVISLGKDSVENKKLFSNLINYKIIQAIKNKDKEYISSIIKQELSQLQDKEVEELLNDLW